MSDQPSATATPRILHLPDGGLVLCEKLAGEVNLRHLHSGESIALTGVFAERFDRHLHAPESEPFPNLGLPGRQHAWLQQLQVSPPSASGLLLGAGLGMLFIELTDQCNESCIHCYAESSPQRSARLSREEIERVLEQARTLGNPSVQFTGGDPLLHPDLVFGVRKARELGFGTVEIYTNGLALNKALFAQLLPYRPSFAFSVYASNAAMHDAITQVPGSLERTIKAMRRVQAAELPLRVGIVLMPENRDAEGDTRSFLQQEMGLDPWQIGSDMVRSTGRGEYMEPARPASDPGTRFRHSPKVGRENNASPREDATTQHPRHGKLCVSASGDVYPCIFSRRTTLGSIRAKSLADILASLNNRAISPPSGKRWQQCRESLSCSDCQAIAYLLQDDPGIIPIKQEGADVAA